MKNYLKCILMLFCSGVTHFSFAESNQTADLLNILKIQTPEVKTERPVEQQKIIKDYKNEYVVDWVAKPKFDVNASDMKTYKNPVKIRMTILGSSGLVIKSEIVKSSGSKAVDAKVVQALASAKLQPIPYADQTVIYELVHDFAID